jgi:ribosomal protein S18 acetylase RimI-like enzyme
MTAAAACGIAPRRLEPNEHAAAAALFARAFLHDPFTLAVGPGHAGLRLRLLERSYGPEIKAIHSSGGLVCGVADEAGALVGALTADEGPVEVRRRPSRGEITSAFGGPGVLRRAMVGERALARARPAMPHIYIVKVAVTAERRGTGIGRALISSVLADADERGLPVLLDTMTEENVRYYERYGFRTTERILLPRGLRAWLMTRPS